MFIGSMNALDKGRDIYPKVLTETLEYIKTHDFSAMDSGEYPMHDGIFYRLSRYKTKKIEDCLPESHRQYIDIRYVVAGEECVGWCPISPDLKEKIPYNAEQDVVFYEQLVPESSIILMAGNFAVLYPEDVHRPCIAVDDEGEEVTKVVVKIPLELVS